MQSVISGYIVKMELSSDITAEKVKFLTDLLGYEVLHRYGKLYLVSR
jgi:hypothetical protein